MNQQTISKEINYINNVVIENKMFFKMINIILEYFKPIELKYDLNADRNLVGDLIITLSDSTDKYIGFRIRCYDYYLYYSNDLTIRQFELKKILEQKGDYYLYAFMNENETEIIKYSIIDLNEFRKIFNKRKDFEFNYTVRYNKDDTKFYAFKLYNYRTAVIKQMPYELD